MSRRMRISRDVLKTLDSFGLRQTEVDPRDRTIVPGIGEPAAEKEPAPEVRGFTVAWRTDRGKVRQNNQDAVICDGALVGVADGMGGHQGGEVASAGLRDLLTDLLKDKPCDPQTLASAVRIANRRLFIRSQEDEHLRGMGTTLDVLWIGAESVYCAHVGDSRVYLLRNGELKQITDDHSMVMEMYRAGLITAEQAAHHPMRNIITRAVGTESGVDVDLISTARQKGDVWLVCSDGLHGMVKDEDIADILGRYAPEEAAGELLSRAMAAGGLDNISLVVVLDREGVQ